MEQLIKKVSDIVVVGTGTLLFIYVIFGILLSKVNKKKYGKTTVLAWIPILNIILLGKLALHSIFGFLLLILTIFSGALVVPNLNLNFLKLPELAPQIIIYSTIGMYILFSIIVIFKAMIKKRKNDDETIQESESITNFLNEPSNIKIEEVVPISINLNIKEEIIDIEEPKYNEEIKVNEEENSEPIINQKPDLLMPQNGEKREKITFINEEKKDETNEHIIENKEEITSIFKNPIIIPVENNNKKIESDFNLDMTTTTMTSNNYNFENNNQPVNNPVPDLSIFDMKINEVNNNNTPPKPEVQQNRFIDNGFIDSNNQNNQNNN